MKRFYWTKEGLRDALVILFPAQILLVVVLSFNPSFVERYYSHGIYPVWSSINRIFWGWIPISVGDLFYTITGYWMLRSLWQGLKHIRHDPLDKLKNVVATLSVIYGLFYWGWGLNYFRLPLEEQLGIETTYTTEELTDLTARMVSHINDIHGQLVRDSTLGVTHNLSRKEIFQRVFEAYKKGRSTHPLLDYPFPSQKTSLYSIPLTYMGYGGYLNPFTGEAQINGEIPPFRWASVAAHEVGHQIGYSAEDDTNFIGYWVCLQSDDPYLDYAASSSALAYLLGDLSRRDREAFDHYYGLLNEGIRENYRELRRFWDAHENPMEPVFKAVFNSYLKANQQSAGIESYSRVVALLIGFDQKNDLLPASTLLVP